MSIPTVVTTTVPTVPSIPSIPSIPSVPSMNTESYVTSGIKNTKTISFMDKIIRDIGRIFSFKGMYNLSSLMLHFLIIIILLNLMSDKPEYKMYSNALSILIISSILFSMISYIFDNEVVDHDHTHENKSHLSTQPIVVK